jgi:hypothetical protein
VGIKEVGRKEKKMKTIDKESKSRVRSERVRVHGKNDKRNKRAKSCSSLVQDRRVTRANGYQQTGNL